MNLFFLCLESLTTRSTSGQLSPVLLLFKWFGSCLLLQRLSVQLLTSHELREMHRLYFDLRLSLSYVYLGSIFAITAALEHKPPSGPRKVASHALLHRHSSAYSYYYCGSQTFQAVDNKFLTIQEDSTWTCNCRYIKYRNKERISVRKSVHILRSSGSIDFSPE